MFDKPAQQAPARWKVIVAFGLVYLVWGSTYLAIRLAVDSIPPYLMVMIRFLIAGTILFIAARLSGAAMPRRVDWRSGLIIGGLLLVGGNGGISFAEQKLPTALTALMVASVPLWMGLIEWLRPGGSYPAGRGVIGLVIGFAGIMILVGPDQILAGKGIDLLSTGVVLLATILWAVGSIYSRTTHAHLPESPLMATAVEMLGGGILLLPVAALTGEFAHFSPSAVTVNSLLAIVYLILIGSLVGYTSYVWLLKVSTPARVSTYAYVNPVVAVILGVLVLGEKLTPEMLRATPLIILAVILVTTSPRRKKATAGEALIADLTVKKVAAGVEK
jgi:drug/metabolite transporter (DMT)-like permease